MKLRHLLSALSIVLSPAISANIYSPFCPLGCPESKADNNLVFTHIYALSNNPTTKFADWVAYEVDVVNFGPGPGRNWANNPVLPEEDVLEKGDYSGAYNTIGADRGHMAPLAAFAGSQYWYETNYISNIVPQASALNQGAWEELEQAIRDGVSYGDSLFVINGSLYEKPMADMPKSNEDHEIPSAFYKLVYDEKGHAAAFIMEQDTPRTTPYCSKQVSLDELKSRVSYLLPDVSLSGGLQKRLGC
ncbi:DNA/RNA non-specific endonuclease [Enterovibrio norvegicus]|uniref:DNA/RNA non-specific endonuclease n=1 Tax=Enterovibrio norvegicus TaxID=188144 RepID=UPI000C82321D|nr:DNA/RNA non-specific endonuclease [Enterovibrio norvegicus]PMH59626.1 DNA/RNA endonuclease [Enterovibrio norvegicus]